MKLVIFCFLFFSYTIQSQNFDNIWMLGRENVLNTVLNFDNNLLHVDTIIRNMPFDNEAIIISDSTGNLLFYTNGIKINNAQYQLMQNGNGLNPGQIAVDFNNYGYIIPNGMISIPHPNQTNKYYLFHQSLTYASDNAGLGEHLYYTLIDMNANNGLGIVEIKNQILISDSIGRGQLQVVKHGNGKDWWLVQHLASSNGFYTFLVTGDTIIYAHQQYIGNVPSSAGAWQGQSVFSPDGAKYARYDNWNDLDIFDFDRCTGLLSNPIHIPIQDSSDTFPAGYPVGIAISPNSQYLYVSSYNLIYQFDLLATNVLLSKDTVAEYDGFWGSFYPTAFSAAMLGLDNKIYILPLNTHYLHVIDNPDIGGINCTVQQHSINVPYRNGLFLPNFPHYRTGALAGSVCDTLTSTITVSKQTKEWKVILYPNPTSNQLTVQSNIVLDNNSNIEIYNTLGQLVKTEFITSETNNVIINVNSLMNGIYIIRLRNGDNIVTKPFVVSK